MDSGLETLLGTSSSDGSDSSSPPSEDSKSSSPPPKGDDSKSSDSSTPPPDSSSSTPPPDSSSSTPPPESSPPPPDSSPPPPDSSPPPSKSESPPPKEESPSPPPPKEESPESESPPSPSTPDKSPSPKKSPSPDKSPEKSPGTPPPANSPPPPASGAPPALTVSQSPPLPGQLPNGTRSQPPPADKLSPPSRPGSGSSMAPRPASSPSSSVNAGIIAGVTVVGVGILVAVIICLVCAARKKKRKQYYMDAPPNGKGEYYGTTNWNTQQNPRPPPGLNGAPSNGFSTWTPPQVPPGPFSGEHSSGFSGQFTGQMGGSPNLALNNQSSFSYEELARATNGFADENVIGQGGYGYVHKGVLPSGKEVAVKSLKSGSGQGDREFQAEVEIISRVHHRHLVSLVGYCVADGQRMLVYEFVPNKTLEFHLHGKGQPTMLWSTRMRIALGAAKGLAYLHEDCHPKIIHRDIKAANILIDFNFEAMVADFGLAKLTSDTSTHVSTRVMGTFGYMAPEYASSGKLTDKSDVFSFGVMLLELITGRKPIDPTNQIMEDSLVDWARPLLGRALEDGNYGELVDPLLENKFDPHEMNRMIACAAASVRHSARRRPKMTQIARSLEGDQSSLDDTAIKQGQSPETATYDTTAYNADMMKFKQMVMSSNYASEDFEQTSDYGLQPSTSSSDLGSREFPSSGPQKPKL